MTQKKVVKLERGWAGHFICANDCRFRRNTLLTYGDTRIVVSTVGLMETPWKEDSEFYKGLFETIGHGRYYETMAFYARHDDTRYYDIDVTKQINFNSEWCIPTVDADDKANEMHEAVVDEITLKLMNGDLIEKD